MRSIQPAATRIIAATARHASRAASLQAAPTARVPGTAYATSTRCQASADLFALESFARLLHVFRTHHFLCQWMPAHSPLVRVKQKLTTDLPARQGPCSSSVAAIDVFGHSSPWPCRMLVWRSPRHGSVTGPGYVRHCAVGTGTVWSDLACAKRIRRHRGGALAPPRTSEVGPLGERSEAGPVPRPCASVYGSTDPTHSMHCRHRQFNA